MSRRRYARRLARACCQAALLGCVLLVVRVATAADGELGIVVLDRSAPSAPGEAWPEAEQRTRAELDAVGLSVVDVAVSNVDPSKPADSLSRAARKYRAVAAVRLIRFSRPPGVEIWLVDEVTGKTSMRHVSTGNLPPSEAIAVVAFAVVELLNASLLELRAAHRPRGKLAPTEAVFRMVDRNLDASVKPHRFAVRGGTAVIGSPGGLGLMAGPVLAAGWGPHPKWLVEAEVLATIARSTIEGRAGEAQVGLGIGRLQLVLRSSEVQRLQPMAGIGAGVLVGWTRGQPTEGYRAENDATAVALPSAVLALAARVSETLRIRLALNGGFAVPALSTTLASEPSATAGRPLLDGTVALEWILSSADAALP